MKTLLLLILEILPIFNIYKVGFSERHRPQSGLRSGLWTYKIGLEMLEGMQRENDMIDDGSTLGPIEVYNVLERIMYNRRSVPY